jgi:hypothetical protein
MWTQHAVHRRIPIALARLTLLALVVACYRPFSPHHTLTQRAGGADEVYRDPAFAREDLYEGRIAPLAPRLAFSQETQGPVVSQGLTEALEEALPAGSVIRPSVLASRVNEAGLTSEYSELLSIYDRTGILEWQRLRPISEAVAARFVAVPILMGLREGESGRLSVLSFRIAKTSWASPRLQLQVWDATSGRIVWEGTCEATLAHEEIRENPVRLVDAIRASWDLLISRLPSRGPPPGRHEGT